MENEKIILTKEQEKRVMEKFNSGDIWGLKELQKILKEEIKLRDNDNDYTIYDLIKDVIAMNNMYVWGCEDTNGLGEYYIEIEKLYDSLKTKLFNQFSNNFEEC